MARTMTWSIVASDIGAMKFEGNIFTNVSIKLCASFAASYVRSDVESAGKNPFVRFAMIRPIVMANAVVTI